MDGQGGGGASHGTAAELEAAQDGVERSRFSPGRIEEFKQLAADPRVYEKVRVSAQNLLCFGKDRSAGEPWLPGANKMCVTEGGREGSNR